jgi:hypothetical protein
MRLALLLRYRHRLPMQANRGTKLLSSSEASAPSSSSQDKSDPRPGIKRSYSAQARVQTEPSPPPLISTLHLPPPVKLPRAMDNTAAFSSARRGITASPSGRGKNHFRKGMGSVDGASSSSSQQQLRRADSSRASKRRKHGSIARSVHSPIPSKNLLEGPFHDKAFIVQEYFKSGTDLRQDFKKNPKSPLHNFYAVIKSGQQPKYESVQGTFGKSEEIWRCAATPSFVVTAIDIR